MIILNQCFVYRTKGCESVSLVIKDGVLEMYIEEDETEVIIPEGVKHIADEAFRSCRKLESIIIPYGVKSIGRWTFANCRHLKNVTLPNR